VANPGSRELVGWALGYLRPHRPAIVLLAGLSLAEVVLRALNPWALKSLVDYALVGAPLPASLVRLIRPVAGTDPASLLLVFVLGGGTIQLLHQYVLMRHTRVQSRTAQLLVHGLRAHLFAHVQTLALVHHTRTPTGETVYHLEADAGCIEHLIFKGVFPVLFSALTLIVMFGTLARIDPLLGLCAVSVVPALYLAVKIYTQQLAKRADRVKLIESEVSGHLHETISGIALTKSFGREQYEVRRFSDRASKAVDARLDLALRETRFAFAIGAVTAGGMVLTLGVGGWEVLQGRLTLGTLLVVLAYLGFVYGPMSVIANIAGTLEAALVSARRVRRTLDLQGERSAATGIAPASVAGRVAFERVSFSYGDTPVLDDVSFTAEPGQLVAIVGPSGAGKTTLVTLINRFNDPRSGRVLIDGMDARHFRLSALRAQIAFVLQEALLISGTVRENIRYGRLEASDGEVSAAAQDAFAHEFIERLPQGYDTEMEKAGAALSGGQRQRLSIARAFLKNAPILVLDEPTSALDPLSERQILYALRRLRKGRTTFVIAHRLSTVKDADRILVLDKGRLVAEGTHRQLVGTSPIYREMCKQFSSAAVR
jgi:ATP-binding cassette, subfamily B, bacterial